jgi:hypothetical protein
VFVNLAFNVNIETLTLTRINMGHDLSTLRRVLSTIDASNHIHRMELRMDATDTLDGGVNWDSWDEVYKVLAGHQFQSLKALYIHIGPQGRYLWFHKRYVWRRLGEDDPVKDDPVVLRSKDMVDENPLLAARGASVSYSKLDDDVCMFCPE